MKRDYRPRVGDLLTIWMVVEDGYCDKTPKLVAAIDRVDYMGRLRCFFDLDGYKIVHHWAEMHFVSSTKRKACWV